VGPFSGDVKGEAMDARFFVSAFATCFGPVTVLLFGFISAPLQAQETQPATLTPDQQAIIAKIAKPAGTTDIRYAAKSTDPIGTEIKLPFQQGKSITLVRKNSTFRDDGSITWVGEVAETGERAVLMLWGNALLTGYFAYKGTIFAVESLGGAVDAYKELGRGLPDHPAETGRLDSGPMPNPKATPPRAAPAEPTVPPFPDKERKALEAKNITIDLMLLYTRSVASRYTRDPEDLLALAVEETNETFRNSGLGNIRLRLVHTELIDYDTSADDQFNHLYAMVDGVGPFKDVKTLRNEKRADIVGLIIDNPTGCGLSTRIGPESDEAFFVVHHACATITMSVAHEIGHILGVRHDRFVDETNTPFAYGHGYVDGVKWRDIMSYNVGCGGCPRIPFWSNPRVMYKGSPTGTPAADSARVILELAEQVSKFR
jgi:Metallo-peptidase family M12